MTKNRAMTLVEILLVIIITAVVLAMAAPNFSKVYLHTALNQTAEDIISQSRWAQAMAIAQKRDYALAFSDDRRSYGLVVAAPQETDGGENFVPVKGRRGLRYHVPDTVRLDASEDRIEFYPDGTIDPATIRLNTAGQQVVLTSAKVRGIMTKDDQ